MPSVRLSQRAVPAAIAVVVALLAGLLLHAPAATAAAAPAGLSPSGVAVSGIPVLSWGRVPGADGYNVQYGTDPGFGTGTTKLATVNSRYVPKQHLPAATIWWRVQSRQGSVLSDWSTTNFNNNAYAGPTLISPTNGAALAQPNEPLLLTWTPVTGAASYTVEVDDSPDFLSMSVNAKGVKNSAYLVDNANVATQYYWRVKAVFDGGVETMYSEVRNYQILGLPKPTRVYPPDDANNAIDDVVLKWNPVLGAHHYELQVSLADSFEAQYSVDSQTNLVGTTYSPATTYHNDQYFWRVRPVDAFGNKIPWENVDVWQFRRSWPLQPTLEYPPNNSFVGDPFYFQWSGVPLASTYTLQMSTSPIFAEAVSTCGTVHTTFVPTAGSNCWPGSNVTYYWRVFASDGPKGVNTEEDHAAIHKFTYKPWVVDDATLSPADGETVSVPTFSWGDVAGAASYRVTVTAIDGGLGAFTATTNTTSYTARALMTPGKTYKWNVVPISESGRQGSPLILSAQPEFTIGAAPVGVNSSPVLTSPASGVVVDRAPLLTWEPVAGATYYRIETRDAGGNVPFEPLAGTFAYPAGQDSASANLPEVTQWRVVAYNAANEQLGSPSSSRTYEIPIQLLDEVTGYRVANTGDASDAAACETTLPARCEDMRQTPVFRWDPQPGAGSYKLWISKDPTYTQVLGSYNGIRVDGTMFMPTSAFAEAQAADAYYWHVVPCTKGGACRPRTDATHAVNKRSNPVEPNLPLDGAIGPDSVTFTWGDYLETNQDGEAAHLDSTGVGSRIEARSYRIDVSSVPNFQSIIDTATVDQKTYTAAGKFYPEGILYWRVAALDGTGNLLTFSEPRMFTKKTPPPVLHQLNGGVPLTQTLPLSWDPAQYAATYQLEIYKNGDTGGPDGVQPQPTNKVVSMTGIKQAAVSLLNPLPPSPTPYTWRIRKVDATGNAGPWSVLNQPFASFQVVGSAPTQTSPANGQVIANNDGYFSWTPAEGAKGYRFERRLVGAAALSETVVTSALGWAPVSAIGDGTWEWRVVAINVNNEDLGASGWSRFKVDGTRPTVKSVSPQARSIAKRTTNFKATFSEPVTNVTKATVRLYLKGRSKPIPGKVTLNATKTVMKFNPKRNLKRGKKYTIKLSAAITDLSGLSLAPYKWKITVKK